MEGSLDSSDGRASAKPNHKRKAAFDKEREYTRNDSDSSDGEDIPNNDRFKQQQQQQQQQQQHGSDNVPAFHRRWKKGFRRLVAFHKKHGTMEGTREQDESLHRWICRQRRQHAENTLPADRAQLLESIDFPWEDSVAADGGGGKYSETDSEGGYYSQQSPQIQELNWEEGYQLLQAFRKRHGSCEIPFDNRQYRDLYHWIWGQRKSYKHNCLSDDQEQRLEAMGFVWNPHRLDIVSDGDGDDESMRRADTSGESDDDSQQGGDDEGSDAEVEIKKLMQVPSNAREQLDQRKWIEGYLTLKAFQNKHGTDKRITPRVHRFLYFWTQRQRYRFRDNKLSSDRIDLLKGIGFRWGNANQDDSDEDMEPSDGDNDRSRRSKYESTSEDEESGGDEEPQMKSGRDANYQARWMEKYKSLKAYKRMAGNLDIPSTSTGEDLQLYTWTIWQRRLLREQKMQAGRRELLAKIGFGWGLETKAEEEELPSSSLQPQSDAYNNIWMKKYRSLKSYKRKFGNLEVSSRGGHTALYSWIVRQRKAVREKRMPADRKKLLDKIEFDSQLEANNEESSDDGDSSSDEEGLPEQSGRQQSEFYQAKWMEKYQSLKSYKRKFGNLEVPSQKGGKYQSLYFWVLRQRRQLEQQKLSEDRKELLDKIGFHGQLEANDEESSDGGDSSEEVESGRDEEPQKLSRHDVNQARWMEQYERLKSYKRKFGDLQVPRRGDEQSLYFWVLRQRRQLEQQKLSEDRKELLGKIGFDGLVATHDEERSDGGDRSSSSEEEGLPEQSGRQQSDFYQAKWMEKYESLKLYQQKFGDLKVPYERGGKYQSLYFWKLKQRREQEQQKLSEDRQELLDKIGFDWQPPNNGSKTKVVVDDSSSSSSTIGEEEEESGREDEETWMKRYQSLKAYSKKYGCVTVPLRNNDGFESLALWSLKQQSAFEDRKMPTKRRRLLDKLGFYFGLQTKTTADDDDVVGDANDAVDGDGDGSSSGEEGSGDKEVSSPQRILLPQAKNPSLAQHQSWLKGYENLKAHKEKHGSLDIRFNHTEHRSLYTWIVRQRRQHWEGTLASERKELLEAIDFPWQQQSEPQNNSKTPKSASENHAQRKTKETRPSASNDARAQKWMEQYRRLKKLKKKFGTMEIQHNDTKRRSLYNWIWRHRRQFKDNDVSADRVQLLDDIGFDWVGGHDNDTSGSESGAPDENNDDDSEISTNRTEVQYEYKPEGAADQDSAASLPLGVPVDPGKVEGLKRYLGAVELQLQGKRKEIKQLKRKRTQLERG